MDLKVLRKIIQPVFKRRHVPSPKVPPSKNPCVDDFGVEIKEVLLAAEIDQRTACPVKSQLAGKPIWQGVTFKHTARNFKQIALQLGITVYESSSFYYVRDLFLQLQDQSIAYFGGSDYLERAMECVHSSNLYLDKTSTTRTRNQLFNYWGGYSANYRLQAAVDRERYFSGRSCNPLKNCYVEGGNVLRLTNGAGEQVLLVGRDHLLQSLVMLQLENRDWEGLADQAGLGSSFAVLSAAESARLSDVDVQRFAEEMYSLGLLSFQGQTGVLSSAGQLNLLLAKFFLPGANGYIIEEGERGWFREMALKSGLVRGVELGDETSLSAARVAVGQYLVKQQITRALMAGELQIPLQNLHFIPQLSYHLDTFIAAAAPGAVYLVDYAFWGDLLEAVIEGRSLLELSEGDVVLLEGYCRTAKKMALELGDLLRQVRLSLEAAGLRVVAMPGHLVYESEGVYRQFPMPSEGICVNFMNAFTGYSPAIKRPYYITHGLQVGEKVGVLGMHIFREFLKSYDPEMACFYIGFDPGHPADYSEALDFWNRLETQSGIHCLTFPLKMFFGYNK